MQSESEIREQGINWDVVEKAFLWMTLSIDFIRQLVEHDPIYKTQLQHHLLCAFHRYASYPSYFYQNMFCYLNDGLATEKQLANYVIMNKVYNMYRSQKENESNARREVAYYVDGSGKVLDSIVYGG